MVKRPRWSTRSIATAVVAVWTVLTLLSVAQAALTMPPGGPPVSWASVIALRFADWYSCLLFVPAFVWISRRYPMTPTGWRRALGVLLAASAAFVVLKYLIFLPITKAISGRHDVTFARLLASNALIELIIFWAVIAVIQAFQFRNRLEDEEHRAAALQAQLTTAQLGELSARLQPHFLFNTLGAIATLIHRDVAAADQMVTRLGDLLRATLAMRGAHEIPLRDELDLLERYLDIMRIRFSDRLTVVIDVAPEAREALVPQLLLQPLVENALEHGIARQVGPGRAAIVALRAVDQLRITVEDDGPGVAPGTGIDGVGLGNTRERLRQLYGEAQSLTLSAGAGGVGVVTTVLIPWRTQPQ